MKKILLYALLLISATSYSQKVGVVLSGGGAKGLAHIGVLKALEENNIPVDYIVGTSMGGVVGGSYAAGYSPEDIEYMVLDDQFLNWINGRPEDDFNYNFYNKEDNASLFSIRLALDSTFNPQFNTTLANDFSLNFALTEKLSQPAANANYNFDSLFIPFRVVASEVFTQKSEIIKAGSLSNAIRAALSVPFFYKPIRIDGRYLFDGGIYNNFPTDVAKAEFNPDFLIGVNVSSKVFEEYPYDRDNELISNSLFYMLLDKSDLLPEHDSSSIYIEPNLLGYTALDFDKARELIDSGYNAAMRMMPELLEKIKVRSNCEDLVESRNKFNSKNRPFLFSAVEVYEFNERQEKFIKKLFSSKNDYITLEEIKKSYFRLMSEPFFQTIYPNIRYDENTNLFVLELHGRPQNDLSIALGGNISSRNSSAIYLGGEFYYFSSFLLDTYFNVYGGNFYKSAQLRSRMYFPSLGHWYIEPDFTYNNFNYLEAEDIIVDEESPTILDRSDRNYGLNAGIPLGLKYKLVLSGGYVYNKDIFSNNEQLMFTDTLDFMRISGHKAGFRIFRNTLNKKMFPTDGLFIQFSTMYYRINEKYVPGSTSTVSDVVYNDHNWFQGKFHFEKFHKYGNKSTGYLFDAVISNQPSFSSQMGTIIYLPAFNPLIDSRTLLIQNFRSSSYIAGGVRQIYEFNPKFNIRFEGHVFKEMGSLINSGESTRFNFSKEAISFAASASLVYTTPMGPFNLSFNYYDDKETQFGILLNFGYLIFNRSSIE